MASSTRKKRRQTPYSLDTSPVRLTTRVKEYIISKAKWGESMDQTLRRLWKLGPWTPNESKRRNNNGR